jgi:hypothetical protein
MGFQRWLFCVMMQVVREFNRKTVVIIDLAREAVMPVEALRGMRTDIPSGEYERRHF